MEPLFCVVRSGFHLCQVFAEDRVSCSVISVCWATSNNFFLAVLILTLLLQIRLENQRRSVPSPLVKMMPVIAATWDAAETALRFISDCIGKGCITRTTQRWRIPYRSAKRPDKLDYSNKLVHKITLQSHRSRGRQFSSSSCWYCCFCLQKITKISGIWRLHLGRTDRQKVRRF